jgi:AcrR family transcriptional regulator
VSAVPGRREAAGRPRDPLIHEKVVRAAIHVYARDGWTGFTFESVAREAGVGKPSIYRRWQSREGLLVDALDAIGFPTASDKGSLRADLLEYAASWVAWYLDHDKALADIRLFADCLSNAELSRVYDRVLVEPRVQAARAITRRAQSRGELKHSTAPHAVVELLLGAIQTHYMFTPPEKLPALEATFASYAEMLVDLILEGVSPRRPTDE